MKTLVVGVALALVAATTAGAQTPLERFNAAISGILATPYQPSYAPLGPDEAFAPALVPNTAPAQDYTSGSIPGSPDHPDWPAAFRYLPDPTLPSLVSADGALLRARVAIHEGVVRPGIVVVHGFNTNAKESVIRWAAMLYARGYNVIAADQRDFKDEYDNDHSYPTKWPQTFGWKEATDVLAAGRYLKSTFFTVSKVGVIGFSLGGQDTVLALALDATSQSPIFSAGLNFSGPADQNYQIWTTRQPEGCSPPSCSYPATTALVALVVPPYTYNDACKVVTDAGNVYGTSAAVILAQDRAYEKQLAAPSVPLLSFYSSDDSLVKPTHATLLAGYQQGNPLHRTFLIDQGEHAYFFDRWWQQSAILQYFRAMLTEAADTGVTTVPTVNRTDGGTTAHVTEVTATPAQADALVADVPPVCTGGPTSVALRSFTVARHGGRVVLRWRTGTETGVAGFNVYAGRTQLNRRPIRAAGDARGHAYSLRTSALAARYSLEVVRLDGSRSRISAAR